MSWTRHVASTLLKNVHSLRSNAYMARRAPWCIFQLQTRSLSTMDDVFERARAALQRTESNVKKLTPEEAWAHRSKRLDLPAPADRYAGRRIPVTTDLRSTFLQLSRRLHRNAVYREWKLNTRHEKRGIKRSRLRSERWRKRFADEVRRKVQLVSTIRRRG